MGSQGAMEESVLLPSSAPRTFSWLRRTARPKGMGGISPSMPTQSRSPSPPTSKPQEVMVRLALWARSDVGRRRRENQDSFAAAELSAPPGRKPRFLDPSVQDASPAVSGVAPRAEVGSHGVVLLVADGMGGPAGGERASRLALTSVVTFLRREWSSDPRPSPPAFMRCLLEAVHEANAQVHREGQARDELRGMGTTLTLGGVLGGSLFLVHVGDSRAYLLRNGSLVQLTRDQSMVQELLDAGAISEAEARTSPQRNVILQAIGTEPRVEPVVTAVDLRREDLILLCSDGLCGPVPDPAITEILVGSGTLPERCEALVDAANRAGGPDNVTVVLGRVEGEEVPSALPGEGVEGRRIDTAHP